MSSRNLTKFYLVYFYADKTLLVVSSEKLLSANEVVIAVKGSDVQVMLNGKEVNNNEWR